MQSFHLPTTGNSVLPARTHQVLVHSGRALQRASSMEVAPTVSIIRVLLSAACVMELMRLVCFVSSLYLYKALILY